MAKDGEGRKLEGHRWQRMAEGGSKEALVRRRLLVETSGEEVEMLDLAFS
jgi:hypothetical protein